MIKPSSGTVEAEWDPFKRWEKVVMLGPMWSAHLDIFSEEIFSHRHGIETNPLARPRQGQS